MAKNIDICRVLFAALPDHYFKCKYCGTVRHQLPSSGYGKLMSHLKDKHAEYEADYLVHASSHAGTLHSFGFVNDKIANIYHWMEWVVDRNMPLSEVDQPLTRSMSHLKPMSSKTLKRHMDETTKAVERAIAAIIPSIFGVMYDGCLCFAEHFVAMYIVFWRDDQLHCVLLAVAPLDEADQTTASHVAFIRNMLTIYGQSPAHLRFLIARSTDVTPLRAKETRRSLTLMLERYVRIRDAIKHVDAVDDLVSKPAAHRCAISLIENLKTFNSICKKLQEDTIPMSAVRVLFDKMTEIYPVTEEYLLPDAHIVHSPAFESAVVKVEALEPFELEAAAVPTQATSGSGVSTRSRNAAEDFATALLRSDAATPQLSPRYSPIVAAMLPTSNLCERLLLQCKLVMTPQQSSLLPVNFEMIAFVRANRNF
uniref:BED-type domain-containing protein n=1 Tax=Phytophthora ramorum TaxID=164328 RepID=H3GKY9_PHYRM